MPSKLEHALNLATHGFYVFPCEANGKLPTLPWRERSSRNAETIKNWFICSITGWQQDYNIGIDCAKSGITVVDVDVKAEKKGRETYERLDREHGFPETLTVKTPTGGLHLYYRGGGFRNTQGDHGGLGSGVDTRGEGGFVVAPGSAIGDKEYHVIRRTELAPVPEWLKEKLAHYRSDLLKPRDSGKIIIADNADDIKAAIEFLQNHEPAVEGHGGDHHTFVTFCQLKERGIAIETAIALALEYWNPNCIPAWDVDALTAKANSAYKSAQNATGAKSPLAEFDIPAQALIPQSRFNPGWALPLASSIPPRDWVFGDMWLAKQLGMLISMPGVGKSTFTLSMALSKATGRNLLGIDPKGRGAVAVFNNEDNMEEQARRLVAAAQYYHISAEELLNADGASLFFLNGREMPLRIAKRLADGRLRSHDGNEMIDYALKNQLRLMIVDPFSMTHPASENSNEEIMQIGMLYNYVAEKANCAVVLVHHTRKLNSASSEGHSGNLDSARGASALGGLVRSAYTLDTISTQEAKRSAIPEKNRRQYILLEQAKANMSAPAIDRKFYQRHGEVIGISQENPAGESVGVLLPVKLEDIATNEANAIADMIKSIESLVEGGEMCVPDIARSLVTHFPFYYGKQDRTLAKAIKRLFSEGVLTGFKGTLHLEDRGSSGSKSEQWIILKPTDKLSDQLDALI